MDDFLKPDLNRKKYIFVPPWAYKDEKTRELLQAEDNIIFIPDYTPKEKSNECTDSL